MQCELDLLSWRLLLDLTNSAPRSFAHITTCRTTQVISMRCRSNLVLLVGILACAGVEDELASLKPTSQATCVGQSQLFQLTPAIGRIGASIRRARFTAQGVTTRVSEVDGYLTNTLPEVPVDRV